MFGHELRFLAYGTVIPDVRSLVYANRVPRSMITDIPKNVFDLHSVATGTSPPAREASLVDAFSRIYGTQRLEMELRSLLIDAQQVGFGIRIHIPEAIAACSGCIEALQGLFSSLPQGIDLLRAGDPRDGATEETVFVARAISSVESLIASRHQVILYESPQRLRRELILRGLMPEQVGTAFD